MRLKEKKTAHTLVSTTTLHWTANSLLVYFYIRKNRECIEVFSGQSNIVSILTLVISTWALGTKQDPVV